MDSRRIDLVSLPLEPSRIESSADGSLIAALSETHLKRSVVHDSHPDSAFSPLPQSFNIHRNRKEKDRAGQRAELDQILEPAYKNTGSPDVDESSSTAGPSRLHPPRTAGGLVGERKHHGLGIVRPSQSMSNFRSKRDSGTGSSRGVYLDSNGKIHDTEFDPFAGVSEMSRKKSRRRSAFGQNSRKASDSSSSSVSGSDDGDSTGARLSVDGSAGRADKGEDEQRRKIELERRRQDEASSLAAAKRRSMFSDRSSIGGRATPSIMSNDDALTTAQSLALDRLGVKSRSGHGYVSSPLSPTFGQPATGTAASTSSFSANGGRYRNGTIDESPPQKTTQVFGSSYSTSHLQPQKERKPMSVSVTDKKITVTGFDAPNTPATPQPEPSAPVGARKTSRGFPAPGSSLQVPDSGRLSVGSSRRSTDSVRPRPQDRPREESFPETPAQTKRRQERERRAGRSANTLHSRVSSLAIDTTLTAKGSGRILPEIEIVEDDDPRIIFPEGGRSTRVQTKHDHVIRGPFSHALEAATAAESALGRQTSLDQVAGGSRAGSTILDEGGGYLPSRWAGGDRELRVTEDEKEKYRPKEWGKHGETHGGSEEWR